MDGRKQGIASGMTFEELAAQMLQLGCKDAINLDGGGSSVMAVRDAKTGSMKTLNQPTDGRERAVADVLLGNEVIWYGPVPMIRSPLPGVPRPDPIFSTNALDLAEANILST